MINGVRAALVPRNAFPFETKASFVRFSTSYAAQSPNLDISREKSTVTTSEKSLGQQRKKRITVISGASGGMGTNLMQKLIQDGVPVVGLTRTPEKQNKEKPLFGGKWERAPKDSTSPDAWLNILREVAKNSLKVLGHRELDVVQLAGESQGPYMRHVNYDMPIALQKAVISLQQETGEPQAMVQMSSACANEQYGKYTDQQYIQTRRESDRMLVEQAKKTGLRFATFQPGFVFQDLREDAFIDNVHPWSPEQLTYRGFMAVVGSGKQLHQPVYMDDLTNGIRGALADRDAGAEVVSAVGSEAMTLENMIGFFVDLTGNKRKVVYIPADAAYKFVSQFPHGRLAEYGVALFDLLDKHPELNQPLCSNRMAELAGRNLKAMSDIYKPVDGKPIVLAKGPLGELVKKVATGATSWKGARTLTDIAYNHTGPLLSSFARTVKKSVTKAA